MTDQASSPTIMQVVPELDTGGAELTAIEVSEAVIAAGGRAVVVSEGGRLEARLTAAGATHIRMDVATKNPFRMLTNARRLKRLIADQHIDIVHARSRAPAWSALWATTNTPAHFVTTYHGAYNQKNAAKGYYNSVMARGERVIANSNYTADLIRKRHGTPEERLRVIYRGVDLDAYDPAHVSSDRISAIRAQWRIPEGADVILHPARLTTWKGQRVVIEAAAQLFSQGAFSAVFVLAGDHQGREEYLAGLKSLAADRGIADHVRFPGHCADMPAAYATAALALVPSIEPEAFGRTAAEAQAMACPVIASRIGAPQETVLSLPEIARDKRTGWLVPVNDAAALATAITDALSLSDEEKAALAARARSHVATNFSLKALKYQTLAVYDELLGTSLADAL